MASENPKNDPSFISSDPNGNASQSPGPFLAKVISHLDPSSMGGLEVEILRQSGNSSSESQTHQVKYMSPFFGSTAVDYVSENNDYNGTQKSYGMWMVPPDPGTTVVIFFIDGDPKRGYWFGCVPDENMNFMVPGLAATEYVEGGGGRMPVAEYNKKATDKVPDATKTKKPRHPLADSLEAQGLLKDDIRGLTSSSARRETPSSVFGISTPGPLDKRSGATQGPVGKKESRIQNAYVSRLGGSTFVMDDGDDKFIRKTFASEGPPEYSAVEQGETSGLREVPHNELIRLRTRTGHQILMHTSEDLIYICNSKGTAWIELTSNGKIDIYAKDSVSIHTENDINFTADRDINLTAKGSVNINAAENYSVSAGGESSIKAGGNHTEQASQIHMNGPSPADTPKANRVPGKEPWAGHENLDPTMFVPDKTKSKTELDDPKPDMHEKYTTVTDTFAKVSGGDE